ncbi:hypothetical protein PINS_up000683 [Pythium insidiosum]|nr:hypothetical protein PINS_up000683 [Pythium insidiosum]
MTRCVTMIEPLRLSEDTMRAMKLDPAVLREYVGNSDQIMQHSIRHYASFMRQCRNKTLNRQWQRIGKQHGIMVYEQERYTTSVGDAINGPPSRRARISDRAFRACVPHGYSTYVSAFGGGEINGSMRELMSGLYADSMEDHEKNCMVQFGRFMDAGMLLPHETRDDEHPYRFMGVKWLESARLGGEQTGTIDELCWVERLGVHRTESGREFGYQLLKTVDFGDESADIFDGTFRSIHLSVCYLYYQVDVDTVHVFMRGIIEIPHSKDVQISTVRAQAARILLGPTRGRACYSIRVISSLMDRSKTDREEQVFCRCSKVLRGLPRTELCSTCRHAMRQPKLISVNDLRKSDGSPHSAGRRYSSCASSATTASDSSVASSSSSALSASSTMRLRSHRGTVRLDGQLPTTAAGSVESDDEFDDDPPSLRMFMPIQELQSGMMIREERPRNRENVLIAMLRKHEDARRLAASDDLP